MKSTILDEIVARVKQRVSADKTVRPIKELKRRVADAPPPVSFSKAIGGTFGLIAEIKRSSPSQGYMLHQQVLDVARVYQDHSFVRAVSVLTNRDDFEMSIEDLAASRKLISKPILRKDFIFDEYQVYESRVFGADAILLMANILTDPGRMLGLFDLAEALVWMSYSSVELAQKSNPFRRAQRSLVSIPESFRQEHSSALVGTAWRKYSDRCVCRFRTRAFSIPRSILSDIFRMAP